MRDHAGPFDRIVASLHEVALDYSRWPAASALIDEALGTPRQQHALRRWRRRANPRFLCLDSLPRRAGLGRRALVLRELLSNRRTGPPSPQGQRQPAPAHERGLHRGGAQDLAGVQRAPASPCCRTCTLWNCQRSQASSRTCPVRDDESCGSSSPVPPTTTGCSPTSPSGTSSRRQSQRRRSRAAVPEGSSARRHTRSSSRPGTLTCAFGSRAPRTGRSSECPAHSATMQHTEKGSSSGQATGRRRARTGTDAMEKDDKSHERAEQVRPQSGRERDLQDEPGGARFCLCKRSLRR